MSTAIIHRFWKMTVLLLVQLLVLNHVHLFGYATPIVLTYLTMNFERGCSRVALLLWGFVCGLIYDMFSNTMGLGMASGTLLAMLQPSLLKLFTPRDAADDMRPSFRTLGTHSYLLYAAFTILIYHAVFYALDAFTLRNWTTTLVAIGCGTAVAFLLVALAQTTVKERER